MSYTMKFWERIIKKDQGGINNRETDWVYVWKKYDRCNICTKAFIRKTSKEKNKGTYGFY